MTDLLPCPFCGEKPKIISGENTYSIHCGENGCIFYINFSSEEIKNKWNTRTESKKEIK